MWRGQERKKSGGNMCTFGHAQWLIGGITDLRASIAKKQGVRLYAGEQKEFGRKASWDLDAVRGRKVSMSRGVEWVHGHDPKGLKKNETKITGADNRIDGMLPRRPKNKSTTSDSAVRRPTRKAAYTPRDQQYNACADVVGKSRI